MAFQKKCLDVSQGFIGDPAEMLFKPLTEVYLSHWWLFRESIRAGIGQHLKTTGGQDASDASRELLLKLAHVGYAVYLSSVSAAQFASEASGAWALTPPEDQIRGLHNARRQMKACYESLYTLAGGVANSCAVLFSRHDFSSGNVMIGATKKTALNSSDSNHKRLGQILTEMEQYLQMRHHEVHYWVQLAAMFVDIAHQRGYLGVHADFQINNLPVPASTATPPKLFKAVIQPTLARMYELTDEAYQIFYTQLDRWLASRNENIDYSAFGPHNDKKPVGISKIYTGVDPLAAFVS